MELEKVIKKGESFTPGKLVYDKITAKSGELVCIEVIDKTKAGEVYCPAGKTDISQLTGSEHLKVVEDGATIYYNAKGEKVSGEKPYSFIRPIWMHREGFEDLWGAIESFKTRFQPSPSDLTAARKENGQMHKQRGLLQRELESASEVHEKKELEGKIAALTKRIGLRATSALTKPFTKSKQEGSELVKFLKDIGLVREDGAMPPIDALKDVMPGMVINGRVDLSGRFPEIKAMDMGSGDMAVDFNFLEPVQAEEIQLNPQTGELTDKNGEDRFAG